jgi:PAS domain S-box-containing protein
MSPAQTLLPLVTAETVPTETGEMLLFHVEGSEARYLSPFRHAVVGRQSLQRSRQILAAHARAAAAGRDGFVEMADYRGVLTFAAIRWLAPAGWGLVLKIDRAEALAGFHHAATMVGLAGGFLVVALGALLVGLVRHRQRADLLHAKMHQERALWHLRSYAETIVASVPSGLIVLSGDLRILSANRAFLHGFGLRLDDVLGRRLEDTLHAEGLLPRLREALDTGVARHDLLTDVVVLSRRESRSARITMTGIHVADDEDARLLLILHDLSEEKPWHAAHRTSEQRFHELAEEAIRHSEDQVRPAPKAEEGGQQTVLLVEDADRVREVVREILELSGYRVLEAHDGQEALGIAHQHQGPIHVLVADVVMPHMSGRELTRRLLELRPQTRVLYMSESRDDSIGGHDGLEAGMSFIAKPFRPDALTAKVRQVLEGPPPVNGAAAGPDERLPQLAARR